MNAQQKRRLGLVLAVSMGVAAGVALMLSAFQQNLLYFYSPSQVAAGSVGQGQTFRLGGLVAADSVVHDAEDSLVVHFAITDQVHALPVRYRGLLPDLFREGQGIIAQGALDASGVFIAAEVLAKHDENYMPPEVADALKEANPNQPYGISW